MCRKEGLLLLLNPGPGLSAGRSDVTTGSGTQLYRRSTGRGFFLTGRTHHSLSTPVLGSVSSLGNRVGSGNLEATQKPPVPKKRHNGRVASHGEASWVCGAGQN